MKVINSGRWKILKDSLRARISCGNCGVRAASGNLLYKDKNKGDRVVICNICKTIDVLEKEWVAALWP
jgi:hypothetical protein